MQNISGCLCAGENSPIGLLGETGNALGRGKICRAKSSSGTGADPDMQGPANLSQKQTLHLLRKEGRHSLWIQVKGELVGWEGKDDQGDI